jgi:hypothetical protein
LPEIAEKLNARVWEPRNVVLVATHRFVGESISNIVFTEKRSMFKSSFSLNKEFMVQRQLPTTAPAEQVFAAVERSLRLTVSGTIHREYNSLTVENGTNNLSFAFFADLSAVITLTQPSPGIVDINGTITLKPNTTYWVCVIFGLFFWPIFFANFLYFIIDPRNNYQMALDRVELPCDPNVPPVIY